MSELTKRPSVMPSLTAWDFMSGCFCFLIGPDRTEFMLHTAIVARQSKALNTLVAGPMKEANEKKVVLEQFSKETFLSFSQFMYTGQYTYKRFVCIPRDTKMAVTEVAYHTQVDASDPMQTEAILHHARVWVLADYFGVKPLEAVSRSHFRLDIANYTDCEGTDDGLVQIMTYVYANTAARQDDSMCIRSILNYFAASRIKHLWEKEAFRKLLENNDVAVGLLGGVAMSEAPQSKQHYRLPK